MATRILTDARIEVDANVLSDDANQVELSYEAETQDDTVFGDDTRSNKGGLKNWTMSITFLQDWDAAAVDAILFPLVGSTVTVKLRPTSAAIGTGNPEYVGLGVLSSYTPMGNSVGELASAPVEFVAAGTLARNTV